LSTEFKTLKECIEAKKGAFIGVIIKQGDLNSGTTNDKDWTNKKFTITDATGDIELTAWGDEIAQFKVGNKYEFTGCWFKEYNEEPVLAMGKYGKAKLIGTATVVEQTAATEPGDTPTHEEAKGPSKPLGQLAPQTAEDVGLETVYLLQIEAEVKKVMKEYSPGEPNNQKVGMFVKEIYRKMAQAHFAKAGSETRIEI
jgi:hypothetical protein